MFKQTLATLTLATASSLLPVSSAQSAIINFDSLAGTPITGSQSNFSTVYTYFSGPATIAGMTFATPNQDLWVASHINSWLFCFGYANHCATNYTDHVITLSALTVRRADGGAFSLNAFDLGNWFDSDDSSSPAASSYRIDGYRATGPAVTRTLTLDTTTNADSAEDFNHFTFDNFRDITRFELTGLTVRAVPGLVLDNLDLDMQAAAIPEPATLALTGLGMLGLALRRKRTR